MEKRKLIVGIIILMIASALLAGVAIGIDFEKKPENEKSNIVDQDLEMKRRNSSIRSGIMSTLLNITLESSEVITNKTNYIYEIGIWAVKDNTVIKNKLFVNIPVGIIVIASNVTIKDCVFIGCSDEGIAFINEPFTDANNNTVKDCVFYNCLDGIELQKSSGNKIIDCLFLDNYHVGVDGIMDSNNNNDFVNCTFYGNCRGVYFYRSFDNQFYNCTFINNESDIVNLGI